MVLQQHPQPQPQPIFADVLELIFFGFAGLFFFTMTTSNENAGEK